MIGARGDDGYKGAAYIFDTDGTNEIKILANDKASAGYQLFGTSVTMTSDANKVMVGANDHPNGGAAYF